MSVAMATKQASATVHLRKISMEGILSLVLFAIKRVSRYLQIDIFRVLIKVAYLSYYHSFVRVARGNNDVTAYVIYYR